VTLERPPRTPAGALTDRVRTAILRDAERAGITPAALLVLYARAEYLGTPSDIANEIEERYQLGRGALVKQMDHRADQWVDASRFTKDMWTDYVSRDDLKHRVLDEHAHEIMLLEFPEPEFLTAVEHVAGGVPDSVTAAMAETLFGEADGALQAHGAPYRRVPGAWRFEWVGDPAQHAVTVRPALLALADPRLAGARAEFEEALAKRRRGAPKDLEDAVDEAAKSVESVLKVLHHEHNVALPAKQQISSLFNTLVTTRVLPGYIDQLIAAPAGPRNHMASHGQGGTVREVPAELADASIAAAAVAITFLAHYLP
jgi:hypothetical protein